jgi:hypothetical protein
MGHATRFPALLLAVAVLAGSAAPALSIRTVIPCMDPADCAAMGDLCDMTGMTSQDSCCQVSSAGDVASLPATQKYSAGPEQTLSMIGSVMPVALPVVATGLALSPLPGNSSRSSPASIAVLRI